MRDRPWLARAKEVALSLLTGAGVPALARRLSRRQTTIFMLHRFAEPGSARKGHDPTSLRRSLEYLRRKGYQILALEEAVRRHVEGDELRNAVCFTVDDGYEDFASLAAPVFSAYDCPVTVFLTTGFLDGETWPWWDQLEHVFRRTSRRQVELDPPEGGAVFAWEGESQRQRALGRIVERCKTLSDGDKWALIGRIADRLDVAVPDLPPAEYRPLTWDQVRALGRTGLVRFGPHTVTHPILSKVSDEQRAEWEITRSRTRVEEETSASSPLFCYPNGDPGSFGAREIGILARSGFLAAVTTIHGYMCDRDFADSAAGYALPRFPYPEDIPRLIEAASGMRRLRPRLWGSLQSTLAPIPSRGSDP